MFYSGFLQAGVFQAVAKRTLTGLLLLSWIGLSTLSWAEDTMDAFSLDSADQAEAVQLQDSSSQDVSGQDTASLGPLFAPLTDRKDLSLLNRLSSVSETEAQNNAMLQNDASPEFNQADQGKVMDEVVGLETQTEAEKVIFHDDGTVEFRDNMQPLLLNQKDILASEESPSLLRELDNQNDYLLFTAPLSTEFYEVTTEEKLIDPEAHQFLPGFQQAFDAMAQNELTGTDTSEIQTGHSSRKSKKSKQQKAEQKNPPVRPLQQSPPLPTIESIHITRLNRTPAPAEIPAALPPAPPENVDPLASSSPSTEQSNAASPASQESTRADIKTNVDTQKPQPVQRSQKTVKTPVRKKAHKAKHLKTIDVPEKDWQPAKTPVSPAPQSDTVSDVYLDNKMDATAKPESEGVSMPAVDDASNAEGQAETLQDLIQRLESPSQ